uniref:Uncharacterized protein n=1 Tax=uncultured marine virus TaxID=186617 RepID=A0A0F7L0C3_9VIRU|nr:hypothetical protein [uncultured marine virus]
MTTLALRVFRPLLLDWQEGLGVDPRPLTFQRCLDCVGPTVHVNLLGHLADVIPQDHLWVVQPTSLPRDSASGYELAIHRLVNHLEECGTLTDAVLLWPEVREVILNTLFLKVGFHKRGCFLKLTNGLLSHFLWRVIDALRCVFLLAHEALELLVVGQVLLPKNVEHVAPELVVVGQGLASLGSLHQLAVARLRFQPRLGSIEAIFGRSLLQLWGPLTRPVLVFLKTTNAATFGTNGGVVSLHAHCPSNVLALILQKAPTVLTDRSFADALVCGSSGTHEGQVIAVSFKHRLHNAVAVHIDRIVQPLTQSLVEAVSGQAQVRRIFWALIVHRVSLEHAQRRVKQEGRQLVRSRKNP